jgi:hypothetical protein
MRDNTEPPDDRPDYLYDEPDESLARQPARQRAPQPDLLALLLASIEKARSERRINDDPSTNDHEGPSRPSDRDR